MLANLKNTYVALRHGESKANVAEIIVSNLSDAINEDYSLTQKGEEQVRDSVYKAKEEGLLDGNAIIYSSLFSRCKKTAEIAKEALDVKSEIIIDDRLRERWFGSFDKTSTQNYQKVWNSDQESKVSGVAEESVESVKERTFLLVEDLEKKYNGSTILLVSHGDVLQILETQFAGVEAHGHRQMEALTRGEIRKLNT